MRKMSFALLLLLGMTGSGNAQVVPLVELTEPVLRERVQLFLRTPEGRTLLNPIARLVRLRADQIVWEVRAGRPVRLLWAYETLRELNETERLAVQEVLRGALQQVFTAYRGGLLAEQDRAAVLGMVRFVPASGAAPESYPQPKSPSSSGGGGGGSGGSSGSGSAQAATIWYYPCWYCGGYYPCWGCCWWGYPCWGYGYYWTAPVAYYAYPVVVSASAPAVTVASAASTTSPRVSPPADDLAHELMLIRLRKATDPELLFTRARTCYWQGDSDAAVMLLRRAIELNSQDARFWYFRALAERALGEQTAARTSAQRGAALEMLHKPNAAAVALALERVQGAERRFLRHVTEPLTVERATEITRAPLPDGRSPSVPGTTVASKK